MINKFFNSKIALLYVISLALIFSSAAWMSLLNNFAIEVASFDGSKIGILQSLREIPGFLSFSAIFIIIFLSQQKFAYLSIILLGLGVLLTGFFPNALGLYLTTVIMSIGFHYLETMNQSLSLQWLNKKEAPIILGKITAAKAFTSLVVFILIYIMMKYFSLEYKILYLFFGGTTLIVGVISWIFFKQFKEEIPQEKKINLKKEYWLYYTLTFLAGARRQIFVVFAGFLLVEKFGLNVENMVILLFINSVLNIYFAPKIGRFIRHFGERITLRIEYLGLIIVFISYGLANNIYLVFFLYILDHLLFSMAIALKTYFQKIANPKDIASASAVSFTINHIAAIFLPAILGILWLYSSTLVFIFGAGVAILSFSLSFLIPKEPKRGYETIFKHR